MKVRIVSNGTRVGTKVFDAETGRELTGIGLIWWEITPDKGAKVEIVFNDVEVDIVGSIPNEPPKYWQHEDTGYLCIAEQRPSARWYQITSEQYESDPRTTALLRANVKKGD